MKKYIVYFVVGLIDGLIALAGLVYASNNLSPEWSFFLGAVWCYISRLTKRAADERKASKKLSREAWLAKWGGRAHR